MAMAAAPGFSQTRKTAPARRAPPPAAMTKVEADCSFASRRTRVRRCLPLNLHNLHLYSEEQVKARRAYARYTATIGVLTMDNTLLSRAVVQNEVRTATDLIDRVSGGAGPGSVKAVAPTGVETSCSPFPKARTASACWGRS